MSSLKPCPFCGGGIQICGQKMGKGGIYREKVWSIEPTAILLSNGGPL